MLLSIARPSTPARAQFCSQDRGGFLDDRADSDRSRIPGETYFAVETFQDFEPNFGDSGFHSAKHDLLLIGDMFASYFFSFHKPPALLNSVPEQFLASIEKSRRLNPRWIVSNHYDFLVGTLHRRRFAGLYGLEWPAAKSPAQAGVL